MDLAKVLHQLREELDNLNAAILSLERLQETGKHRTNQPEWFEEMKPPLAEARRRRKAGATGSARSESK